MKGILRILAKDAAELVANPRMLVLSLVIPPIILLLVGQLNKQPPEVNIWISGLPSCRASGQSISPDAKGGFGAGFLLFSLTPEQRMVLGSDGAAGVIVIKVEPNSVARKAGLEEGDLLIAVGDSPIASQEAFERAIAGAKPGDEIFLTVRREGAEKILLARIGSALPLKSAVFRYLDALSYVSVTCRRGVERDPFKTLAVEDVDLLLNLEGKQWGIYITETNPRRLPWLLDLAQGIRIAQNDVPVLYKVGGLGALPLRPALLYYPQSADKSLALLPMTFSLIVCFLAFIIAAPSLVRERELHTLEVLLSAPGIGGRTVLIGKALLPIVVSLIASTFMLVTVQTVYGLYAKASALPFLLFILLPILLSTLLGLLVSALARSQVQTVMASAIYFFCLLLLSGFLFPTEAGAAALQAVTRLFGLTYLLDPANAWFFGADPFRNLPVMPLVIQCLIYAALVGFFWRRQLRRV